MAAPTAVSPQRRAEASAIEAEFGGRWTVSADLGVFLANGDSGTVDASTGDELRARLRARESVAAWMAEDAARQASTP